MSINPDTFKAAITSRFYESLPNNFGKENFDEFRFGEYKPQPFLQELKESVFCLFATSLTKHRRDWLLESWLKRFEQPFEVLYKQLAPGSRNLLVDVIAFRMMGFRKIKLPLNNNEYWEILEKVKKLGNTNDTINPNFLDIILEKFDLSAVGYNIQLYFNYLAIATDFVVEQYVLKVNGRAEIEAKPGDTVLDVGGCWGDTALYFAHKVGNNGKVYSFEFIPGNIAIHTKNCSLNPHLQPQIELIKHPVSDTSDQTIYYKDFGPASKIEMTPFDGQTGSTTTITIDDFVSRYQVEKVDFIKMDIEGAEPFALKGAINTIRKFKPKLAIANYHSMEDFTDIPNWIASLGLGYKLHLGHYTIHSEETIIFAKVDD
jgi:FkbM family methyltransferase